MVRQQRIPIAERETTHRIMAIDSRDMTRIPDDTVQLVVTSPPYPMIRMWDQTFADLNPEISAEMKKNNWNTVFDLMHKELDKVWAECDRKLTEGGIVCINIGDAVRTDDGKFRMYPNHSRIIQTFLGLGYTMLPDIHWRKPTNAPTRFMGSGMYPTGAYVTYEHEYILVFRKGDKRTYTETEKATRQESAYFWEERNVWFSDLWEINGAKQATNATAKGRKRSAACPLEIPYRLVQMYSLKGDTVLDPFTGTGTTNLACLLTERNSIGCEINRDMAQAARDKTNIPVKEANKIIRRRLYQHNKFIESQPERIRKNCYTNTVHDMPVKTQQETKLIIRETTRIEVINEIITCKYREP